MNWLKNASTRVKLLAGFAFAMVLMLAVLAAAYLGIESVLNRQTHLFDVDFSQLVDVLQVDGNNADARLNIMTMLNVTNRAELDALHQQIKEKSQTNEVLLLRLVKYVQEDTTIGQKLEDARDQKIQIRREILPTGFTVGL